MGDKGINTKDALHETNSDIDHINSLIKTEFELDQTVMPELVRLKNNLGFTVCVDKTIAKL